MIQALAWVGAVGLLVGYLGLQRKWWGPHAAAYLLTNAVSTSALLAVNVATHVIGYVFLNTCFLLITLHSFWRRKRYPLTRRQD